MNRFSRLLSLSTLVALGFLPLSAGRTAAQEEFLRGDVNVDGNISISDTLMLRRWLFNGDRWPPCHDSADVQDDGHINLTDAISVLNYVFLGGPPPLAPYPDVGPDTTEDELPCMEYDVVAPELTEDVVELGGFNAVPAEEVRVPVIITNAREVEAFQLVIRYDPDLFTPKTNQGLSFEGTAYDGFDHRAHFLNITPHEEAGIFTVGFIPSLIELGYELSPGEKQLAFEIVGTISADAPVGVPISLVPIAPEEPGFGPAAMRNELTHRGEARFVSTLPRTIAFHGIVGDQTFFIRADSNNDRAVDLSDAQHTLSFLFLGGPRPACFDAADSNDDGTLNIADPVATLQFLFLDGPVIPPPFPRSGEDPTPDSMGCLTRGLD